MDLTILTDRVGDYPALALAGLSVGILFGAAAQRSAFCLRAATVEVIDERLGELTMIPWARQGDEFFFMEATTVMFSAGVRISHPSELAYAVRKMTNGSIYFHFLEARRRPTIGKDDFTSWLLENEDGGRNRPYIEALASIDYQFHTLPDLRVELATRLSGLEEQK